MGVTSNRFSGPGELLVGLILSYRGRKTPTLVAKSAVISTPGVVSYNLLVHLGRTCDLLLANRI